MLTVAISNCGVTSEASKPPAIKIQQLACQHVKYAMQYRPDADANDLPINKLKVLAGKIHSVLQAC